MILGRIKKIFFYRYHDIESQEYLSGIKIIDKCYKRRLCKLTVILNQTEANEVKSLKSDLIKSILNSE